MASPTETPSGARRPIRRMASDFLRNLVATVFGLVAIIPFAVTIKDPTTLGVVIGWGFWSAYCLTSTALLALAYRDLSADDLRAALLHGNDQGPRWLRKAMAKPSTRLMLTGGEAPLWAIAISMTSLVMVAEFVALNKVNRGSLLLAAFSILAVVASWLHLWVIHGQHYGREDSARGGLEFPGSARRRFGDYVYAALAAQLTFGTTDVTVTTPSMRRAIMVHSVTAFVFNTVILAVLVGALAT